MSVLPIFITYNEERDQSGKYIGGEMKGVWVPLCTSYVGLIELLTNALGLRGGGRKFVLKYLVKTGMPPVKVECDSDVFFCIQLKKKDVHVLSKFPLCIDVVNNGMVPPEAGESNHLPTCGPVGNANSDDVEQPSVVVIPSPEATVNIYGGEGIDDEDELNDYVGVDMDDDQRHPHFANDIPSRNNPVSDGARSFVNGTPN